MVPSVAVLMSTYNGERYLREQMDSVLSQQGVDVKIIVRDDGSNDNTLNILKSYSETHRNLTILQERNCGAEMSFHRLCQYANENVDADYYAFCDQDDVWQLEKLSKAIDKLSLLENNVPNLYFSNLMMVDSDLHEIHNLFSDDEVKISKQMALIQIFTYGCACVFNRPAIEAYCKANFSRELAHDNWIYVLSMFLGNVIYDNQSYVLYRQHGTNLSGQKATGVKLAYNRIKRATKGHWGHDFELYSSMLLRSFSNRLQQEDVRYISRIANYRKSFLNKFSLLCSPSYRTGYISKDFAIMIRILTNRL